jgi:hypothetical protein
MIRLVLFLGLSILLLVFFRWLSRKPPRVYWQWIGGLVAVSLLVLVATGRAHWLAAVFAALIPFMRAFLAVLSNLPLLKRVLASINPANSSTDSGSDKTSKVQSKYIHMTLYHDSGDINGEVLEGQFKGRTLDQLQLEELLQLLNECQDDEESAALLQTYLDRMYGDSWHEQAGEQGHQQASDESGKMSHAEALQVLGLSSDASEAEIIQAHKRLMQNLHPDRGGSSYLAAKINIAKDTLLAK